MNKPEIPKTYEASKVEDSIYKQWQESGFFNPDNLPKNPKIPFTISLPPPNATGVLHLGHAVMLAIQDLVIRFERMNGKKALWLPGTDHASIATTTKVEKLIKKKEGKTRHDLGREEFIKRVKEYIEQSRDTIRSQMKKMGASCDWSRERYTLDDGLTIAVNQAFAEMYNDGLIYRGTRIVNWCPSCASTLADDEVEYKQQKGRFYYIKYGPFVVATTRPETKIGDTAVAVNPTDERYKKYIGQELDINLGKVNVHIKVIGDESVDPKLGTGAIGVTPAHSIIDYEMAQKNNLPIIQVISEDGKMTDLAGPYAGLPVSECRQRFVADLEQAGLIEKIEDVDNNLSICYRCSHAIEPLISKQWFINVNKPVAKFGNKTIRERALEVVKNGEIQIIPQRFEKTYYHWLENLRDWCISRQLWFGHRIPVWYKSVNRQPSTVNRKTIGFAENVVSQVLAGKTKTYRLRNHKLKIGDVLDFENSQTGNVFGQGKITDILETTVGEIPLDDLAHGETYKKRQDLIAAFKRHYSQIEIDEKTKAFIYTYEFKPLQKTENREQKTENEIYVGQTPPKGEGWIQDPDTLDTWFSSGLWTFSTLGWPQKTKDLKIFHPTSLMETGYDILFFWVARMIIMSTYLVEQVPFKQVYLHGMVRDEKGRKMSKSLDNSIDPLDTISKYGADATRLSLVIGTTPGNDLVLSEAKIAGYRNFVNKLWNIARYILMNVSEVKIIKKAPKPKTLADQWILSELNSLIEFCTQNLEVYNFSLVGEKIYEFTWSKLADWYLEVSKVEGQKEEILLYVLQTLLKLWHPFTPFVTEEIGKLAGFESLLIVEPWPKAEAKLDKKAVKEFELIKEIISAIRNLRAESKIPPAKKINAVIISVKQAKLVSSQIAVIKSLARLEELEVLVKAKKVSQALSAIVSTVEIYLPISGMIDIEKEVPRLQQEAARLAEFIIHLEQKLTNETFITRAPKDIVAAEKEKLAVSKENLEKINQQLKTLK
ncbi:MAG: class I tRNA ligase family protein [Patescibacteria group bacterium]